MEKLKFSRDILRIFKRGRQFPQCIRTIQTSWARKNDESDGNTSKKDNLASLLAGMKIAKAPGRPIQQTDSDVKVRKRKKNTSLKAMYLNAQEVGGDKNELPEIIAEPELLDAARSAAESLPGDPKKTESDILKQLKRHKHATDAGQRGEPASSISDLMSGVRVKQPAPVSDDKQEMGIHEAMNIDADDAMSSDVVMGTDHRGMRSHLLDSYDKESIAQQPYQRQKRRTLYGRNRLNIFSVIVDSEVAMEPVDDKPLSIWELEELKRLNAMKSADPRHRFDEMIQWTEEGKLWKYPIDNEQGLEVEQSVGFHEHVFLDHHLNTGFPKKGPVRHFMELVVTGLSMNPYITVQQKKDHIDWFRQYFKDKEPVLREAGALPEQGDSLPEDDDTRKEMEN